MVYVSKPHVIFQVCFLEMSNKIHSFITGNFNPKISVFRSYSDLNTINGISHVDSLTKLLPLSIYLITLITYTYTNIKNIQCNFFLVVCLFNFCPIILSLKYIKTLT